MLDDVISEVEILNKFCCLVARRRNKNRRSEAEQKKASLVADPNSIKVEWKVLHLITVCVNILA